MGTLPKSLKYLKENAKIIKGYSLCSYEKNCYIFKELNFLRAAIF